MNIPRMFLIGDEWLYIKIYSGPKFLDELLINEVFELVTDQYKQGNIDKFFFIRYADDRGYHLRLRFRLRHDGDLTFLIRCFNQKIASYVQARIIFRIEVDTYHREIERYGQLAIDDIESIFSICSMQIIEGLQFLDGIGKSDERWVVGMAVNDNLLNRFQFGTLDKLNIFESYFKMYANEFPMNKDVKVSLQRKFREYRSQLQDVVERKSVLLPPTLFTTGPDLAIPVQNVQHLFEEGRLGVSFDTIIKSLLHMNCNRLFRTRQRFSEMIMYSLCASLYRSIDGRSKKLSNCQPNIVTSF